MADRGKKGIQHESYWAVRYLLGTPIKRLSAGWSLLSCGDCRGCRPRRRPYRTSKRNNDIYGVKMWNVIYYGGAFFGWLFYGLPKALIWKIKNRKKKGKAS